MRAFIAEGGEHYDECFFKLWLCAENVAHFNARFVGHHDIENNEVGVMLAGQVEGLGERVRADVEALVRPQFRRADVVEEHEGADAAALG